MDRVELLATSLERPEGTPGRSWHWHKIVVRAPTAHLIPDYTPYKYCSCPRYRYEERSHRVKPFLNSFPLEIFQAIIELADLRTIIRTARASFACYQSCMPILLDHVDVRNEKGLLQVFGSNEQQTITIPPRLDPGRNFERIRSLTLTSSALREASFPPGTFDLQRLPPTSATLQLDVFTLNINQTRGGSTELSLEILPPSSRSFLVLLNPAKLIVAVKASKVQQQYVMSNQAAIAISHWTRLWSVRLVKANLVVSTAANDGDDDEQTPTAFFLGAGGELPIASSEVTVVWDLSSSSFYSLPSFGYPDLLALLLRRDDTLNQPWLTSFTLNLHDGSQFPEFERLVRAVEDVPDCLKWETPEPDT